MSNVFCKRLVWAVLLAAAISGCAANFQGSAKQPANSPSVEQKVWGRAQERWDALKAGQYEKAFSYITPSMRATLPLEVYRGRLGGAKWIDVKVVRVVCEPEVCDVSVKMDYYVLPNLRDSQQIEEKWILDAGNWWFVYGG